MKLAWLWGGGNASPESRKGGEGKGKIRFGIQKKKVDMCVFLPLSKANSLWGIILLPPLPLLQILLINHGGYLCLSKDGRNWNPTNIGKDHQGSVLLPSKLQVVWLLWDIPNTAYTGPIALDFGVCGMPDNNYYSGSKFFPWILMHKPDSSD